MTQLIVVTAIIETILIYGNINKIMLPIASDYT